MPLLLHAQPPSSRPYSVLSLQIKVPDVPSDVPDALFVCVAPDGATACRGDLAIASHMRRVCWDRLGMDCQIREHGVDRPVKVG